MRVIAPAGPFSDRSRLVQEIQRGFRLSRFGTMPPDADQSFPNLATSSSNVSGVGRSLNDFAR